ncbi:MAG TPA: hypothetical protein VIK91_23195 [Nannocystis sp.]
MSVGIFLLSACPGNGSDSGTEGTDTGSASTTDMTGTTSEGTTGDEPTTGDSATGTTSEGTTTGDSTTGDPTTGDSTTGGGDAFTHCQDVHSALAEQAERQCQCDVEAGYYPDLDTCLAQTGAFDGACECPLLAGDPGNADHLACLAPVAQAFAECFLAAACDDEAAKELCYKAFVDAYDGCGEPTKSSRGQVEIQCNGEPAFTCGGGEQILEYYVCDEEPDCPDMSDETADLCLFMCGSGETIPTFFVCDGVPDCMDESDEADCG